MNDMNSHMLQYACVGNRATFCGNTEKLSDEDVRQKLRDQMLPIKEGDYVLRHNRCPECEDWTTTAGKLRDDSKCPAVMNAKIKEFNDSIDE